VSFRVPNQGGSHGTMVIRPIPKQSVNSLSSGPRMSTMLDPPVHTSFSTMGVIHGNGANHCLRSSWSVYVLDTFLRSALMTQVINLAGLKKKGSLKEVLS
jgi:hypothetical protein